MPFLYLYIIYDIIYEIIHKAFGCANAITSDNIPSGIEHKVSG